MQNEGDDTVLNGIRLLCGSSRGDIIRSVESSKGPFGSWSQQNICPWNQVLVSFKLQVQPNQVSDYIYTFSSQKNIEQTQQWYKIQMFHEKMAMDVG